MSTFARIEELEKSFSKLMQELLRNPQDPEMQQMVTKLGGMLDTDPTNIKLADWLAQSHVDMSRRVGQADRRARTAQTKANRSGRRADDMQRAAFHDGLLPAHRNQAYMERYLNREQPVLRIDLNDLKARNDMFGHQGGNEMLAAFGQALEKVKEEYPDLDTGREGGDEFNIFPRVHDDKFKPFQSTATPGRLLAAQRSLVQHLHEHPGFKGNFFTSFSSGLGANYAEAEKQLLRAKAAKNQMYQPFRDMTPEAREGAVGHSIGHGTNFFANGMPGATPDVDVSYHPLNPNNGVPRDLAQRPRETPVEMPLAAPPKGMVAPPTTPEVKPPSAPARPRVDLLKPRVSP